MKFTKLLLANSYLDHRGSLTKFIDLGTKHFKKEIHQINLSKNLKKGTLRGLHFQSDGESKIVKCVSGKIFDVVVDCRLESKNFGKVEYFQLSENDDSYLLIPPFCAHGFQSLTDGAEIIYLHNKVYSERKQLGVNAFDPDLGINWPLKVNCISSRDLNLPQLKNLHNV